jgi:hypothetical protein
VQLYEKCSLGRLDRGWQNPTTAQLDSRLRGNDESGVAGSVRMRLMILMFGCEPATHGGLYEDTTAAGWIEEGKTQQRLNWIPASAGMTSCDLARQDMVTARFHVSNG